MLSDPYTLEVLVLILAVALGVCSSWITNKRTVGIAVYLVILVDAYILLYFLYYATGQVDQQVTMESVLIDAFFLIITLALSHFLLNIKKSREQGME